MKKTTNLKRAIAASLSAVVFAACFTACGNKPAKNSSSNSEYGKKLELTVWETQGTDYTRTTVYDNDIVANWLFDKTNVTIKNMYGNDGGQWDAKLSKLVAGGNLPDIVHCGAYQGPAHFAKLDQLEQVWELTPELLKKYAPNVWERTDSELWDAMTVDGKILGIPYGISIDYRKSQNFSDEEYKFVVEQQSLVNDVSYDPTNCLWIRDDILKKFYPEAKTFDELCAMIKEKNAPVGDELLDNSIDSSDKFIDFMYKISKLNLKEDGKKVFCFGYNGGDNWAALTYLGADMYGYKGHAYTATWNDETQRIEIPLMGDMIKQAAKTQNQMINDGVIDPESLTHTSSVFSEKVMNGQYAIVPLSLVSGGATAVNKSLEASKKSFRYRPFITQVPARKGYGPFKEKTMWSESICLLKSLSEEEMHQVLNWINVQYSDEYDQVRNWGPKEANLYTEDENGKRKFVDERLNKFFVEGDTSALEKEEDKLGLMGKGGLMLITASPVSTWTPYVMYRRVNLEPLYGYGFRFTSESEHTKNVKTYPPCQIWSSQYAGIQGVVDFWAERGSWENKIKLAFAAADSEEFETRWADMLAEVSSVCDIRDVENQMTDIAKTMLP